MNPRTNRNDAAIYRDAARLTQKKNGPMCLQVAGLEGCACFEDSPLVGRMTDIFKPDYSGGPAWAWAWTDKEDQEEVKQCRILALCFMAAMVEAGDA